MADKIKYNTRIEAIMAYLRSLLEKEEKPEQTGLRKGEKSLLEQSDIVPVLQGFKFRASENFELFIMNPPIVKLEDGDSYTESED